MDKGKGRASNALEPSIYYDPDSIDEDEVDPSHSTADYATALESALYDTSSSSTNRQREIANGREQDADENEEEFLYDGQHDEDMKAFREDAKLESLDYKDRLRGVLGDEADADEPTEVNGISVGEIIVGVKHSRDTADILYRRKQGASELSTFTPVNGPSTSTPPRSGNGTTISPSHSPCTVRRSISAENYAKPPSPSPSTLVQQSLLPPSQPFPRPRARPPSVSSPPSSTHSSTFLHDPSQILTFPQSSRFGSLPLRRPPMNPLISRLRSTSATPSQSFRGVRSVSQTSSLASLANQDAEDLQGFANESFVLNGNDSLASLGRNGNYAASFGASRRSSIPNIRDGNAGGVQMSRSSSSNALGDDDSTSTTLYPPARRKGHTTPVPEVHELVPPLKWTILKRLSQRLFSHSLNNGKGAGVIADPGKPTCLAVSGGLIVVGMSKGWTMIYDYSQSLKAIAGNDDIAKSCGRVTTVAISQDSTFIAIAYHSGHIHLFEWAKKPSVPARSVIPTSLSAINAGKAEGHLARDASGNGSEIQYLGFVGRRHTAIVSGDHYGLAFYHSLGKVLGLANTDILRILGKYPPHMEDRLSTQQSQEPAPPGHLPRLLGVQTLPLGTEANFTDDFNLVALLTAGKLVVAGLKPTPKTWWRYVNDPGLGRYPTDALSAGISSRSSDVDTMQIGDARGKQASTAHGCLAWLPSIGGEAPMLAWCWDGSLRLAQVEKGHSEAGLTRNGIRSDDGQPKVSGMVDRPTTKTDEAATPAFRLVHRDTSPGKGKTRKTTARHYVLHECSETVSSIQWLNRQIIAMLTMSRVILFDVRALCVVEECSFFGARFAAPRDRSLQQSFRAYKGKLFYLTASDLRVGSVLSWADRVLHLVSAGKLVQAIELLVLYHGGSLEELENAQPPLLTVTLELPNRAEDRRAAVEPRLRDILMASADYAFSEDRLQDEATIDRAGANRGVDRTELFQNLIDASIRAGLATKNLDFLFNDLFERFTDNGIEGIFLDRLEPFILAGAIRTIPVGISQQLISRHAEHGQLREAEDLIWHLDPMSLDVNQVVSLCTRHRLYDALIYVYTRALQDYVGPLVQLMDLVTEIMTARQLRPRHVGDASEDDDHFEIFENDIESLVPTAYTIYSYLADSLVGLSHPSQEPLDAEAAINAKRSLYTFIFSPTLRSYPPGSFHLIHTAGDDDRGLPYLRLLLRFDTEATLDCLDMAMEDSYLDEDASSYSTLDRQGIVEALVSVMSGQEADATGFSENDKTMINIFIARNVPKYRQFLKLGKDLLQQVFEKLCLDTDLSTRNDRELAVEYLLSAYSPTYGPETISMLEEAQFYRVLASIYRSRKAWPQLTSVYLRDPEQEDEVFKLLAQVVVDVKKDGGQQLPLVKAEIVSSTPQLVDSGAVELCSLVDRLMPDEHENVLQALQAAPIRQMAYLRCLLEPDLDEDSLQALKMPSKHVGDETRYKYVALLSQHDPSSVMRYLEKEPALDERQIVNICKERGNFEAVVWILASHGEVRQSLSTAREATMKQSELLLGALLANHATPNVQHPLQNLVVISRAAMQIAGRVSVESEHKADMSVEDIWYDVLSSLIELVRDMQRTLDMTQTAALQQEANHAFGMVTNLIPEAISILISTTSTETLALPHLVRRLMDNSAGSTYSEYKHILDGMLDTYRFEGSVLATSKRLLEADVHEEVSELVKTRGSGWRPNTSGVCEACGRSVWARVNEADKLSNPQLIIRSASDIEVSERMKVRPKVRRRPSLKGKETNWYEEEANKSNENGQSSQSLVVFRGGAVCHAACLEQNESGR